jgi:SOS-response transcriptional repressor LexA
MELKDRLKLAMSDPKVSGTALARACKVAAPSVSEWLSGKTKSLSATNLLAAAKFLKVSPDWLASGIGQMRKTYTFEPLISNHKVEEPTKQYHTQATNTEPAPHKKQVPLISWVRAGGWGEIDDHNPDTADTITAHYSNPSKYAFALTVDGDSMTSSIGLSFPHGCNIIVDPERSPQAGDYVVAKDVISQKATFKKLTTDGVGWYLQALNKDYKTIEIDHLDKRIIGVVIEFYIGSKL